jgi:hypothetical protein
MANSQIPLIGPLEASAAFLVGGTLTVIDGRGQVWRHDGTVTTDAAGDTIVQPTTVDQVAVGPGRARLLCLAGTIAWTYNMNTGFWTEGLDVTEENPEDVGDTTKSWKRGHNVNTPAATAAVTATGGRSKSKKEKEHAA